MGTNKSNSDSTGVSWEQQLMKDDQRERKGEYPYIIPQHAASANPEAHKLMESLKKFIIKTCGEAAMICWFKPCKAKSLGDGRLEIWVPAKHSNFWKHEMEQKYSWAIENFRKYHKLKEVTLFPYNPNAITRAA